LGAILAGQEQEEGSLRDGLDHHNIMIVPSF